MPQLAMSWQWSADGRALTLILRDGVKFQDRETFDADAAGATLEHYQAARNSLRKAELELVPAVEVVDRHTLRMDLAQPYAPLFLNWGRHCNKEFDALLAQARAMTDVAARQAVYRKVVDMYLRDNPHVVLYHYRWLWGMSDKVQGFGPNPDGLIQPQGMEVVP